MFLKNVHADLGLTYFTAPHPVSNPISLQVECIFCKPTPISKNQNSFLSVYTQLKN